MAVESANPKIVLLVLKELSKESYKPYFYDYTHHGASAQGTALEIALNRCLDKTRTPVDLEIVRMMLEYGVECSANEAQMANALVEKEPNYPIRDLLERTQNQIVELQPQPMCFKPDTSSANSIPSMRDLFSFARFGRK